MYIIKLYNRLPLQLTSTDTERMNLFTNNVPTVDRISTLGSNQEAYFLPAKTCGAKFGYVGQYSRCTF